MTKDQGTKQPELDALLDDALEGFKPLLKQSGGATSKTTDESHHPEKPASVSAGQVPADPTTAASKGKALAFDPLARPKKQPQAQPPASLPQGMPELPEDMAQDLSRLLAELAHIDPSAAAGSAGASSSDMDNLGATLRALADQQPTFNPQQPGGGLGADEEALFAQLAQQLEGFAGAPGDDQPAGMSSLVDTIMQQLLSKDVLYQPMKDIGGKYPEWLAENKATLSTEQYQLYEEQYDYIQKICSLYETSPNDFGKLVDLLQEMQKRGSPPQEIVDELAPGLAFDEVSGLPTSLGNGAGAPDCCIQ